MYLVCEIILSKVLMIFINKVTIKLVGYCLSSEYHQILYLLSTFNYLLIFVIKIKFIVQYINFYINQ